MAIATGVLALLGLAVANPDAMIAERNLHPGDRAIDLRYVGNLSPDAVPALTKLPPAQRDCVLGHLDFDLRQMSDDWRSWNLGRERARDLVEQHLGDRAWRCD